MTAGANKFLRIYYGKVRDHLAAWNPRSNDSFSGQSSVIGRGGLATSWLPVMLRRHEPVKDAAGAAKPFILDWA